MAELGATYHPLSGEVIRSAPMSEHLDSVYSYGDRWLDGLDHADTGLSTELSPGHLGIAGRFVTFDDPVTKALVASSSNYIFADKNADILVNQTGTPPTDSILLWRLDTNGTVVTLATDMRDRTIVLPDPLSAFGLDAQGEKITSVADPTANTDAVSLGYLNSALSTTGVVKLVRIATTANDTLSGLAARDGITPVAGDRVLAKDQTTASARGIYTAASGAWARSADYDSSAEVMPGGLIEVQEGTANKGTRWRLDTVAPITLGSTSLTYVIDSVTGQRGTSNGLATLTSGVHTSSERPFATASVLGDSRLSTAPASATDPIAVGDNDSRMANARTPTGAAGGDLSGTYPNPGVAQLNGQLPSFYLSRTNHTGTQVASTISDLSAAIAAYLAANGSGQLVGSVDAIAASAGRYAEPNAPNATLAVTESTKEQIVAPGVRTALYVKNVGGAMAAGTTTFTLLRNGSPTTLTVSYTGSEAQNTLKSITGQSETFAAGDRIVLLVPAANQTNTKVAWAIV